MPYSNLFLAKLPRNVTDKDLMQIFAEYGPISAKVMLDASTGRSKGFGFVLFNTETEGKKAYDALNHKTVSTSCHNFVLTICSSEHSGKTAVSPSTALYIRNIPMTVPQDQVSNFLASFGNLLYCAMREDHHGNPVWVVYAEYDCLECSTAVLQQLHGNSQHFGLPAVMVKYADSREAKLERRRRRQEGKAASAKTSLGACVFPPALPPHLLLPLRKANDDMQTTHAEHHARPLDFVTDSFNSNSNTHGCSNTNTEASCCSGNGSSCVNKTAFSQELTSCSLSKNPNSDASSNASSAYKAVERVFASPVPSMPLTYLMPTQKLPVMRQGADSGGGAPPAMFVLGKGQQLLLTPDVVNVPTSNFAPLPGSVFVPLPVGEMCFPLSMPSTFTVGSFS